MNWQTSVRRLPMIGDAYASRLKKLEIATLADLLYHAPSRYEDSSKISTISRLILDEWATVIGKVESSKNVYTRSGKQIQTVVVNDDSGYIKLVWFNQPFIIKQFVKGQRVALAGKVIETENGRSLQTPQYELVRENKPLIHTGRLVPIYPETAGVSSKWLRSRIYPLLYNNLVNEFLPGNVLDKYNLPDIASTLQTVHFPKTLDQLESAYQRLKFEEVFGLQLVSQLKRREWNVHQLIQPLSINDQKLQEFIQRLPFTLTGAQQSVLKEISYDLQKPTPMNRMLQGDVGSGKTVVAALACYIAILNGKRVYFMAPTEILAQQHYITLERLFTPYKIQVALQTGAIKQLKQYKFVPDVVIGTHALLSDSVKLDDIGLIVIDEQHRFGVRQRTLLRTKSTTPHVLTMTATPIPRSVALTLYGDLDLSIIDEMPHGRLSVKTWVVPHEKRQKAYEWMIEKLLKSKGMERAFIVCPFIEPSESLATVKSATAEYTYLKTRIFLKLRLGLLHGRMRTREKEQVLDKFKRGELDILVCTPVVEVGIDIPEASIMVIEGSDRFGLAQLHQLRGRVGRGETQSYCLLFTQDETTGNVKRLKFMEKTNSGIQLAEFDLKVRGAGSLFGTLQHGRAELKFASQLTLSDVESAKQDVNKLLSTDPHLTRFIHLKERFISGTIAEIAPD